MKDDILQKFIEAKNTELSKQEVKDNKSARDDALSNVQKSTKSKAKLAFSQFEINKAGSSEKLKETATENNDKVALTIADKLDAISQLEGKSNVEQKKGLAALEGMKASLSNVKDDSTKELLNEQISLLQEGLTKQSTLTSTIADKFSQQADNIGGAFATVLGNSPLAGMVTKFVIGSVKKAIQNRADIKQAKLDASKDAAKALAAQNDIVKAVEEQPEITKVEIVGQSNDVVVDLKSKSIEKTKPAEKTKAPTLLNEEKRREAKNIAFKPSKVKAVKKKRGLLAGIGLLLRFLFAKSLGGIVMRAVAPLIAGVTSLVKLVPSAIKGIAKLIPGFSGGDAPSVDADGKKTKQVKKGKGGFFRKIVSGAKTVAKGAMRLAGPAAAVAGAGYAGYQVGTAINDHLLTNKDGTNKLDGMTQGIYDFMNPRDKKNDNKLKYLLHVNSLIKAGATKQEAKQAMSNGKYNEKLKELRLRSATKKTTNANALKKSQAITEAGKEVRAANAAPVAASKEGDIVNAPTTIVNNNSTTVTRNKPMIANQDISFAHASLVSAF